MFDQIKKGFEYNLQKKWISSKINLDWTIILYIKITMVNCNFWFQRQLWDLFVGMTSIVQWVCINGNEHTNW